MNILYEIEDSLYVNITNQCPCRCVFCIRNEGEEINNSGSLWLEHEPNIDEIKEEFKSYNLKDFSEVVFCGYGEPLVRINEVIEIAKFIKEKENIKVRVNTNGLSDLVHEKNTSIMLKDVIDSISISLNAPNKELYTKVTRPKFGDISFDSMLNFAKECKKNVKEVAFSVVDEISQEEIKQSYEIANSIGIKLKVRYKA
ncbi:TIGR04100 family radical SAM protein [Romboutsia sp.]|uniref:TIGR04100 family radical SAM protein n=1 Tax=Romboutsia sp. TaxID=1965302 RepID=UPI003F3D45D2